MLNTNPDLYFISGCGRCSLYDTPECKVHTWQKELLLLRSILNDCDLTEASKWGVPCYTFRGANILLLSAFKDYCSVSFFKGALLDDTHKILVQPTENTQAARQLRFTDIQQVIAQADHIKNYVYEAIEVEQAGLKIDFVQKNALILPDELLAKFEQLPALKAAFEALTPGRQRAYNLHFTAAKQAKTRETRIEKCVPKILAGRGFNE